MPAHPLAARAAMPPLNLMSLDRAAMEAMFADMGERSFHAGQVLRWIYQRQTTSVAAMTDLSKALRARLNDTAAVAVPEVMTRQHSKDGTRKWLLRLADGNAIETVFIPEGARGTLCVSSQAGCALNCSFCATARQGFSRNLDTDEIIGQVWLANRELRAEVDVAATAPSGSARKATSQADCDSHRFETRLSNPTNTAATTTTPRPITNIVMMGMGEPLLNFDSVTKAMRLMMDDFSFGLSRRRVTLSTAGVVPAIDRLGETCPVSLAVSLHAADDRLRDQLVPLNKKYPIAQLLAACRRYAEAAHRQTITFEYVLLRGVNDSPAQARALARLLGDMPAKVNLIPFNPAPGLAYDRPLPPAIDRFRDILLDKNIITITRKTRGGDIQAACGQLAGDIADRTHRARRLAAAS